MEDKLPRFFKFAPEAAAAAELCFKPAATASVAKSNGMLPQICCLPCHLRCLRRYYLRFTIIEDFSECVSLYLPRCSLTLNSNQYSFYRYIWAVTCNRALRFFPVHRCEKYYSFVYPGISSIGSTFYPRVNELGGRMSAPPVTDIKKPPLRPCIPHESFLYLN